MLIIKNHFLPFLFALLSFLGINFILNDHFHLLNFYSKPVTVVKAEVVNDWYSNLQNNFQKKANIASEIKNGGLLIYGSSELGRQDLENISNCFFQKKVKFPAIAVGHAGNQSLSILAQLLTNEKYLNNGKIVILLSPMWFENEAGDGTVSSCFFEYTNVRQLEDIFNSTSISNEYKTVLADYLFKDSENISLNDYPALLVDVLKYKTKDKKDIFNPVYTFLLHAGSLISLPVNKISYDIKDTIIHYAILKFNWDSLYLQAEHQQLSASDSNNLFIENKYYRHYVKGAFSKFKLIFQPPNKNQELEDCLLLIKFLKKYRKNVVFVMQPVHPKIYSTTINNFLPIKNIIDKSINEAGIAYLDMYTTDFSTFKPGTLVDVMHLGPRGWLEINRFIVEQLFKNGNEKI